MHPSADSLDILGLDFKTFAEATALPRGQLPRLRNLYAAAFREGRFEPGDFLDSRAAESLRARCSYALPLLVRAIEEPGAFGTTTKAALALPGGQVECVRIPSSGGDGSRSTICVSSQLGCAMGCAFCETGRGGFIRDLAAAEIVAQVVATRLLLGWNCRNVVFMGMGEPLANFDALAGSLRVLLDPNGLAFAQERITVCTSGLVDGIVRLKALGLRRLNLSISLNATDDASRTRLMPVNAASGIAGLANALAAYPDRRNFVLGVNYCLLPGINDSPGDAIRIADFCARVGRSLVNVIPYNPGSSPIVRAPTDDEVDRFIARLSDAGVSVRRRATRGRSIMAGCGQLGSPRA
ncbi:MAG: 23S rRNA (adenine(2503)-C(2))-methyltransferase RlmN [Spirochaetes bacterium]|nr:23S rRNA (adenine(2503)-C(2))-methyltransferase RlmN [Spirochaetota bacterium]